MSGLYVLTPDIHDTYIAFKMSDGTRLHITLFEERPGRLSINRMPDKRGSCLGIYPTAGNRVELGADDVD